MIRFFAVLTLGIFICVNVSASGLAREENVQDVDGVVEKVKKSERNNYLTLSIENDLFGGDTDQNYTSGLRLGWFNPNTKPPGWTRDLEGLLPFLETNETTSTFYSLGQNLYTPEAVESRTQDPNDRPWAAFLYGSVGMVTVFDEHIDEYEITLGVVGPWALGEEAQKTVHDLINSTDPQGWDNQLDNEPALMLSWQRRWQDWGEVPLYDYNLSFTPHFGLTAGNVYTYANSGATITFSSKNAKWTDKPFMARPAMPGTGFFVPAENFEWKLFAGFDGRAIARNVFLDGNTFEDSFSVDKKHFVLDASAGARIVLGNKTLGYTLVYRTKEFDTQDNESIYGGISLGYNF